MLYPVSVISDSNVIIGTEISRPETCEQDTDKETGGGSGEHLRLLHSQNREVLKEVEKLTEKDIRLQSPEETEEFEKEIINKTDKVAGLISGLGTQKSLNSQELREESVALIKSFPKKMKNQGVRKIVIHPLRGDAVTVRTEYFSPKAKKDKRKKREKVVIRPLFYWEYTTVVLRDCHPVLLLQRLP